MFERKTTHMPGVLTRTYFAYVSGFKCNIVREYPLRQIRLFISHYNII